MPAKRCLVVVPCGRSKIWDRESARGATPARDAYTGAPFRVNRAFAERFGDAWMILSAKHGFLRPDAIVPGQYNVTFKRRSPDLVSIATLRAQIVAQGLEQFSTVIGLGGKEYRRVLEAAFAGFPVRLEFPFAGLPIGKAMQAANRALNQAGESEAKESSTRMAGKYDPLGDYLRSIPDPSTSLTFSRIEAVIGDRLPPSARRHRTWWSNDAGGRHLQALAWLDAGWRVDGVDLSAENVTFART